ncbi:MAG: hypothetical protein WD876_03015 [Candidatus Pacearchaeota archaeon]
MDIKQRLARIHFFDVKPDFSSLDLAQKAAISRCINASDVMTDIYFSQVYSKNHQIYRDLQRRSDSEGKDLLKYFLIHGSPWDAYNHDEPFIQGVGEKPKFGSFYPKDLAEKEWNEWLKNHPEDHEQFESNYTVIKRQENKLVAIPYSEEYKDRLEEAAKHLRVAGGYLPEGNLKTFLKLRADSFRTNNYFDSDVAWIDTDGNPFEVTMGPYEVYFDEMFGLKASFESLIALPDKDSTEALKKFTPKVPEFDAILSQEFNFQPKGAAIPLEVVSDVMRGGEAGFGYMFVAYNLPNDRRIHELKGSKKVFSRTMMEAKFSTGGLPIAHRVLPKNLADKCTFDNRLLFVLGHELAHGIGPNKVSVEGREIPFEVALKDLHSTIEEAKADVLGIRLLDYFRKQNVIDDNTLEGILASEIAAFFQQWNKGFTEAHARGNLVEYNWLKESGSLHYDTTKRKYEIDTEKCIESMCNLSTEFLNLQTAGNYDNAKKFMEKWSSVPAELPIIIESLSDIPSSVSPVWDLSGLR